MLWKCLRIENAVARILNTAAKILRQKNNAAKTLQECIINKLINKYRQTIYTIPAARLRQMRR
jgi:hypothetical protein